MTSITSVSLEELKQRRQKLRRRRQLKSAQALWRFVFAAGIAGSLTWLVAQPNWVIQKSSQIEVEGNQILSKEAILSLLPWSYPQSLFQLEPQRLAQHLESSGTIAKAKVTRQLLPPSLTIEVEERKPVAIALPMTSSNGVANAVTLEVGLIDAQGVWISQQTYTQLNQELKLPTLKVIGFSEQYQPHWSEIYQALSTTQIQVFELDWRDPGNMILKTELGNVHLGSYNAQFKDKLVVLAKMKNLPHQVHSSQIDYIDLKKTTAPTVQLKQIPTSHS